MPDSPSRDATVTAPCPICGRGFLPRRGRRYCSPTCRQAGFRRRHAAADTTPPALPFPTSRTSTGVYECPGCGERLTGERRCPDCNLYARRIGTGGACHGCGEILTIEELLEGAFG